MTAAAAATAVAARTATAMGVRAATARAQAVAVAVWRSSPSFWSLSGWWWPLDSARYVPCLLSIGSVVVSHTVSRLCRL
jgi:hypothetical protein